VSEFHFTTNEALGPAGGIACEVLLGVALLALVYYVKIKLVRNTKDFVIANRKIGFGFGVAGLISIWTWAMAVMMSAAQTYSFGLSGLFWFTVPNGLAVIAAIPFVRKIRDLMPEGYTIPEFVRARFDGNALASGVVVVGALFGSLIEVIINIKGTSLVVSNVFGVDPRLAAIIGLVVVLIYSMLGGLWASDAVWHSVAAQGNGLLTVTRPTRPLASASRWRWACSRRRSPARNSGRSPGR
jgi:Na+/proline symporter